MYCREGQLDSINTKVEIGVPQGSSLVPLLYLICMDNLLNPVQCSTLSMHADDISLCLKSLGAE